MSEEKEYIPRSAMSIQAHPDDQEFSVGGTLAKWSKAGCEVVSVVITSGDSGSSKRSPKYALSFLVTNVAGLKLGALAIAMTSPV